MRIRALGRVAYEPTWRAMQAANAARGPDTPDEVWLVEHPPVYTLGLAGRREHVLAPGDIPVVATDRGGQVTYHGPGQAVAYVLLDLRRKGLGVKELVRCLEQAVIELLDAHGIALNADLDLEPFARIDPCGYPGLACTRLADLGVRDSIDAVQHELGAAIARQLGS